MVLKRREGRVRRRDFMVSRAADVLAPVLQPRICLTTPQCDLLSILRICLLASTPADVAGYYFALLEFRLGC
jgi:hypothetical protein